MTAEVHASAAGYLDAVDQRYTPGRRALVEALGAGGRPLTLPEILGAVAGLAQSSAYRNLSVLEHAGVVHRVAAPGEFARYELAEELTGHHHHLVCTECGAVADVDVPPQIERTFDQTLGPIAAEAGFELSGHRLDLLGRCSGCLRGARSAR